MAPVIYHSTLIIWFLILPNILAGFLKFTQVPSPLIIGQKQWISYESSEPLSPATIYLYGYVYRWVKGSLVF